MIRHIIKLIWNKKGNNILLLVEIFLSFLVLFAVLSYVVYNTDRLTLPTGFDTENRWLVFLDRDLKEMDSLANVQMRINLKNELLAMDNIEEVGFTNSIAPYSNNTWSSSYDDLGFEMRSRFVYADIDFEKTMNINVTEGRWFEESDLNATYEPMIVNQFFMDKYFSKVSMIDSIIPFGGDKKIIGVVDDYRYNGVFEEEQETTFFLHT